MAKSISTLLRAPSGPIDLSEFDPRATTGFTSDPVTGLPPQEVAAY